MSSRTAPFPGSSGGRLGPDMASQFLRLFPLQSLVLFPGMELPLVVFEPRYLQLTRECLDANEPFGVLLLRSGTEAHDPNAEPFSIGTTAQIQQVESEENGRLRLHAKGEQRFRVQSLSRDLPYLSADVEMLDDEPGDIADADIVEQTRQLAMNVVQALVARSGGWVRDLEMPLDSSELSYVVAQMFQGSAQEQQRLLELPTAQERLEREAALLGDVLDQVTRRASRRADGPGFSRN